MIHLTNKIIAINVPINTYDFCLHEHFISANEDTIGSTIDWFSDTYTNFNFQDYKIIGTITPIEGEGVFDFDCERYVENDLHLSFDGVAFYKTYLDIVTHVYPFETPEESFLSLLQSKGLFLKDLKDEKILILEKQ